MNVLRRISSFETGPARTSPFRVEDLTTDPEDTRPVAQDRGAVSEVVHRVVREDDVEGSVREGEQLVRVDDLEGAAAGAPFVRRRDRVRIVVDRDDLGAELGREERRDPAGAAGDVEQRRDIGPEPRCELPGFGGQEPPGLAEILPVGLAPYARLNVCVDRRVSGLVEVGSFRHQADPTPDGSLVGGSIRGRLGQSAACSRAASEALLPLDDDALGSVHVEVGCRTAAFGVLGPHDFPGAQPRVLQSWRVQSSGASVPGGPAMTL